MENGIQLMFDLSEVTTYPEPNVGVSELPAKISLLQDREPVSGGQKFTRSRSFQNTQRDQRRR